MWPVLVGTTIIVKAATVEGASLGARTMLHEAHRAGHDDVFRIDGLTTQILDQDESEPFLYPEYSRRMLEEMYHQAGAAMRHAATLLAGPGATDAQVDEWVGRVVDGSEEMAKKSKVIRRLRHTKGTPQ